MTPTPFGQPVKTVPQLRAWALKELRAQADGPIEVTWPMPLRRVVFPTGMRGIVGQLEVTAPGFAPRRMMVTCDPHGCTTR